MNDLEPSLAVAVQTQHALSVTASLQKGDYSVKSQVLGVCLDTHARFLAGASARRSEVQGKGIAIGVSK
jgi:hypothetical protein